MTASSPPQQWTKEEVTKLRMLGREIGANDLVQALYEKLEQEIHMSWLKVGTDDGDYWHGRYDALRWCYELIGECSRNDA